MEYCGRAQNAAEKNSEASAREKLELVLMQLAADKYSDKDYNKDGYIDKRLTDNDMQVIDEDIVIVDGWKFKVDRETLKIIDSYGKGTESKEIEITSTVEYNDITSEAIITYTISSNESLKTIKVDGKDIEIPSQVDNKYVVTIKTTTNGKHGIYVMNAKDNYKAGFAEVEGIITLDELINNLEKYRSSVLENPEAMKKYASNEEVINRMIESDEWRGAILSSANAIQGLDNSNPINVPIMTGNKQPSGEAFASSYYHASSETHPAWYAFDNSNSTYWCVEAGSSYLNQYVAYDFGKTIWVYKIVAFVGDGKQNTYYVIEGSNDKTNWDILTDEIYQGSTKTIIPHNYNKKYRYYRLKFLSNVKQSGTGNTIVPKLQFYGK